MIEVKVKKLVEWAVLPTRGSDQAAAYDLYAADSAIILPGQLRLVGTGLAIEIPPNYWIKFFDRSSMGAKGVVLGGGVIDPDYRKEMKVILNNLGTTNLIINRGNRIAQAVLLPRYDVSWVESDVLSDSKRVGGFGSTGR